MKCYFKRLVLALPFLAGSSAFAQYTETAQFLHQTNKGVFEVTPEIFGGSTQFKYGHADPRTNNLWGFDVRGEYGVSEMISVGVDLGYERDSLTGQGSSSHGDGMLDPDVFVNGRVSPGVGLIRYGANFRIPGGNFNYGDNSFNQFSGGMTFTPYVGYEYMIGEHSTIGARLSYDLVQTDRNGRDSGNSVKIAGGKELDFSVFYEMRMNSVLYGIDAGLINYDSTRATSGGNTLNDANNYSTGRGSIYAAWTMAPDLTLIPQVGYDTPDQGAQLLRIAQQNTNNSGGLYGNLALRIGF